MICHRFIINNKQSHDKTYEIYRMIMRIDYQTTLEYADRIKINFTLCNFIIPKVR